MTGSEENNPKNGVTVIQGKLSRFSILGGTIRTTLSLIWFSEG